MKFSKKFKSQPKHIDGVKNVFFIISLAIISSVLLIRTLIFLIAFLLR